MFLGVYSTHTKVKEVLFNGSS